MLKMRTSSAARPSATACARRSATNAAACGWESWKRGTWWGAFGGYRPLPETLPHRGSARCTRALGQREFLADELLRHLPEPLGVDGVESVGLHAVERVF